MIGVLYVVGWAGVFVVRLLRVGGWEGQDNRRGVDCPTHHTKKVCTVIVVNQPPVFPSTMGSIAHSHHCIGDTERKKDAVKKNVIERKQL